MTPKEAIAVLMASFTKERLEPPTLKIYEQKMRDVHPDLLHATIHRVIETARFFPSIAEIRETAARLAGLLPVSAPEALAIVRGADVAEDKFDRAGNYAYTERYWHWPLELDEITLTSIKATLCKVGEPANRESKPHFGWETGFQKTYEGVAQETGRKVLADLSRALPSAERKALPEPQKALVEMSPPGAGEAG